MSVKHMFKNIFFYQQIPKTYLPAIDCYFIYNIGIKNVKAQRLFDDFSQPD